MHGAVFGTILVALGAVLLVLGAPALIVLPVVIGLIIAAVLGPLLLAMMTNGGRSATPSTSEASYDPVDKGDRAVQ